MKALAVLAGCFCGVALAGFVIIGGYRLYWYLKSLQRRMDQ